MTKQVIITVGRQYGSGGHEIARKIAAKLDLKLYDRNILEEIAKEKHVDSFFDHVSSPASSTFSSNNKLTAPICFPFKRYMISPAFCPF